MYRSLDDVSSAQGTTLRLSLDDLAEAKADWVLVEVVLARTADVETDLQVSLDFPEEVSAGPAAAVGRRGQACWTNRLGEGGGETAVFLYGAGPFVQTSGASQGVLQDHTLTPFEIGLTMSESRRELPSLRSVSLLFGLGEAAVWAEREGSRFELTVESEATMAWRTVARGALDCIAGPREFAQGDFVEWGNWVMASGLEDILSSGGRDLLTAFARADQGFTFNLTNPQGTTVCGIQSSGNGNFTLESLPLDAGDWTVEIPIFRSLDPWSLWLIQTRGLPGWAHRELSGSLPTEC